MWPVFGEEIFYNLNDQNKIQINLMNWNNGLKELA